MSTRGHSTGNDEVPLGDFGAEEFYDEDDIEELGDAGLTPGQIAAFDDGALAEEEELRLIEERRRASRGGEDDPHVDSGQRLQKVLAHAGVASRRACEAIIAQGRVSVDGVVVTEVGVRVDPARQEIRVDGSRILTNPDVLTVMLHKPAGVVTTMEDPEGRPTVAELGERYVAERAEELSQRGGARGADRGDGAGGRIRLVHVGRLDTDTEGLLLLSNDGELSHRLMHPSYEISKTYVAIVQGRVEPWVPRKLKRGIELEDGFISADRVVIKDSGPAGSILEITLHSGRNRIVRRMCDAVGHPVIRLSRTRLGPLALGGLKPGAMRALTGEEIAALQREVGL
ncbi:MULTISPECIES: pseudouridine synthase [Actinomyces]|uniref:Pseudouridine synthase n=1 Tax=Actinomyces marmotae TaxID=2737173 RepID=A0A6M8AZQ3_9ACTO|nr:MULTISPECIES: pseudouridine synthase [Actinomyces]QKD79704.1 rRNA pseudouridine synthase [Actinomyces marmotae]